MPSAPHRRRGAWPLVWVALAACGCSVPVAGALDEGDANRIVVTLDRAAIAASKEVDPQAEGRYRVTVPQADVARALSAMRAEELPRPHAPGVLESVAKGALVPSQAAEHAQLVSGIGGDLQRTLESIDGVLVARVHLNVPAPDPLRDNAQRPHASASVLLEHRGTTPPIAADAVQRLVAGGVAGLAASDVSVVLITRPAPPAAAESQLARLGPLSVARSSLPALQGMLVALMALVAILAAATIFLYTRLAKARDAAMAAAPGGEREARR